MRKLIEDYDKLIAEYDALIQRYDVVLVVLLGCAFFGMIGIIASLIHVLFYAYIP